MAGPTFDASPISDIGSNLSYDNSGNKAKALSIKDMMDKEQLNALQLKGAKADADSNTKIQALLKGENVDYSNPEGVMRTAQKINQISPKAALEFQTTAQKYQSGKVQNQVDQFELLDHQQGLIVGAIDPIVAQARDMKAKGADDLTINAFIMQQVPGALQQLQSTKLPNGQTALAPEVVEAVNKSGPLTLATLEGFEAKTKAGKAAIEQRLQQMKADTGAAGEKERERHDQSMEENASRKTDQGEEKLRMQREKADKARSSFEGPNGELAAQLAIRGVSLPAGFRSKDQQVALLDGLRKINPNMPLEDLADKIASGQLSFANAKVEGRTAAGVAGKVSYAEHELEQTIPLVREASKELPRGQFVPWNKLQQMGSAADSDPKLKAFKGYMTSLSNAYDMLAARGGTDAAKREHNRELFNTADSPEALEAVLQVVQREAAASGRAADESMQDAAGRGRGNPAGSTQASGASGTAPTQVLRFDAQGNPVT